MGKSKEKSLAVFILNLYFKLVFSRKQETNVPSV